jgi:hypothetical protein
MKNTGRSAAGQRLAQHVEVEFGPPGQEHGLGCGDSLAEPQQVDQQLRQVSGAVAADVRDTPGIG